MLGEPAHGVFWVQPGEPGTEDLYVARLDQMLGRELRQLLVDDRTIEVPTADETRFWTQFGPQLRQKVALASTDGSVRLPEAVPPTLALTVEFEPEHRIRLDWNVRYAGPGTPETFALGSPPAGHGVRDPAAEQALVADLTLPYPTPPAVLTGPDALRFVEHQVPALAAQGVDVTLAGQVVDYRQSTADPDIAVAVMPRVGSADWFDLQVTVSIDGEEVPFDELFVALARGEEYLILETGVYFGLDRPEFAALRDLIAESQALVDHPRPELSINRFQTSLWEDLVNLGSEIDQSVRWNRAVQGLTGTEAVEPVAAPSTLRAELRPYQLDGFRWLNFLLTHQLGGILADDMGLGKTLQALALICRVNATHPGSPPFLVVAPTSVVSNWASEAARFAPGLTRRLPGRVDPQARPPDQRGGGRGGPGDHVLRPASDRARPAGGARVVRGDPGRGPVRQEPPGQDLPVRPPDPGAVQAGRHRHSAGEQPDGSVGAAVHHRPGPVPAAPTGSPSTTADRSSGTGTRARLNQLRRRIRPFLLRRTKDSVAAELPPKQEQVVEVELHPRHQRLYQTHLQRERQKVLGLITIWSGTASRCCAR